MKTFALAGSRLKACPGLDPGAGMTYWHDKPLFWALLLLALLAILKPISVDLAFAAAFIYQLGIPTWLGYESVVNKTLIKRDLSRVLWLSLITFPIYALGLWLVQKSWATSTGYELYFRPDFSLSLLWSLSVNIFVIAWPEEVFYRGFLQGRLGVSLLAVIGINFLFALGHFVGDYSPARLLPFFPGLLFSWLAYRGQGSLVGAITYHALCNVFSEWLAASILWSRV